MPVVLDAAAVRSALVMKDLIPAMARALQALSSGDVVQPVRSAVEVREGGGFLLTMPASAGAAMGAKLVTLFPRNADVPTHHAIIVMFDPATGAPRAIMDGSLITEMRTAAASAAATDVLARREASVLAVIGAGVQARSHIEAMRVVRPIREVRVWSPHNAARLADEVGATAASSAESAVRGADIICVATTSRTPVLHGSWLADGTHINAVGAARPDWRELDDDLLGRAAIYVDSRAAAEVESGDVRAAPGVRGEIGDVFAGRLHGRSNNAEVTLFKSVGVAVEDVVAADLVLSTIRARDLP